MKGVTFLLIIVIFVAAIAFSGCERVSTPYVMKMDRVDQNVSAGNRGYLKGTPPPAADRSDLKREMIAIDVDLVSVGTDKAGDIVVEEERETVIMPVPKETKKAVAEKEEEVK